MKQKVKRNINKIEIIKKLYMMSLNSEIAINILALILTPKEYKTIKPLFHKQQEITIYLKKLLDNLEKEKHKR